MNLKERLQIRTPCGYGMQYWFSYKGQKCQSVAVLILIVAERFAIRFGVINNTTANFIYSRLANKYCQFPGSASVIRSIEHSDESDAFGRQIVAHPICKKTKIFDLMAARLSVDNATHFPQGNYTAFRGASGSCRLCGGHLNVALVSKHKTYDCRQMQSRTAVCRRPMCKSLMQNLKKCVTSTSQLPMARVLMELTKNGDRTGAVAQIKEVAERHIYKTHNWRNQQKRGKSDSGIGIGI